MDVVAKKEPKEQRRSLVTLGELSRIVAHEIRNPLTGISTIAQVLDLKIGEDDSRKKYIQKIIKQADCINRILKSMLSYANHTNLCVSQVNVCELVEGVLDELSQRLAERHITVKNHLADGVLHLECDCELIGEALYSIVLNAIGAIAEGGCLCVGGELARDGDEQRIRLWFMDEGAVIDAEDLEELLSPLCSTKVRGTNLALAVAKKIIETHHGKIYISRNKEKGLTFVVEVPCKLKEEME